MITPNRFRQRCPRCARRQHVRDEVHPQPLVTAIPALLKMSKQVLNDSVGLVFDPWSWKARLVGAPPMLIKEEDDDSQPEPTHKVYHSGSPRPTKKALDSPPDLRRQGPRHDSATSIEDKSGKKTVHFIEPEHKPNLRSKADSLKLPTDRNKLELYEVVCPADDPPRVIDVNYDNKTNRWCIDESVTFPNREDMVAMICSKSVLRAIKSNVSIAGDLAPASSTSKPQFEINRLPDYGVMEAPKDDLAQLRASSHDLYHIGSLEEFLLHAHEDPQRVISASGGQYMRHWLIDLRELVTLLTKPDTGRKCESAFWKLFHRGFVEKVTLQLWGDGDPQPEQTADIENLDWTTWVRANKIMISKALRQDLDRALVFLLSGPVSESRWPPILHPKISIMSHRGITSGLAAQTQVGKAGPVGISTWMNPCSVQVDDGEVKPWVPSAKDPRPPLQTHHLIHASSPRPYPRPVDPPLPDEIVAQLLASRASKPRPFTLSRLPNDSQMDERLAPEQHGKGPRKLSEIGSLYSAMSVPAAGPSSLKLLSDDSIAGSDLTGKTAPTEENDSVTHGQAQAKVDYGRETGGLVEPGRNSTKASRKVHLNEKNAAARTARALRVPKAGTSAYECERLSLEEPDLTASRKRAVEVRERMAKSWAGAISQHGQTSDNAEPPTLDVDATEIFNWFPEFSYQLDEVLDAEHRLAISDSAADPDLEKRPEDRVMDRLPAESQLKRILREELNEEWAHSDGLYESLWRSGSRTTDIVKDPLPHFKMDARLAQLEGLSDNRRSQPIGRARLLNDRGNIVNSEMGMCKLQLEMANEAVMHLKRMLDVANKEATEAKKGRDSITRELEQMKEDLAQLKTPLHADAEGDQDPKATSRNIDRPQALCEDISSQWWSEEKEHDEAQFMPVQGGEGKTQPVPTSPTAVDVVSHSRPNDCVNGLRAESEQTSPTLDCQPPLKSADTGLCRDTSEVPPAWTPNGFDQIIAYADPSDGYRIEDTSQANCKVHGESDKVSSSNDTGGDQASSQADSESSAETIKFANTSGISPVDRDLPNGVARNDVPVNGAANKPQNPSNAIAVASSTFHEDIVNDTLVADSEDVPIDISVRGPGKATDLPSRDLLSARRKKRSDAIQARIPAKSASESVLSREVSPI
ncbi:hypothetical protein N0V82_005913 [Gnomoniopsis sp. IMI 355080]|nr:hypothetical protein N0V82_005913 [Gnomoniopsis sp. IMI 355080]